MLKFYTYSLPFVSPFKTAGNTFNHREGIIVTFENKGITAFGEIAPLPGFSEFDLQTIISILQLNKEVLENALLDDDFEQYLYVLSQIHNIPSLKFGLDTLAHDYKAKLAGVPLTQYLFNKDFNPTIRANASLGIGNISDTLEQAQEFSNAEFNTFKLKVGGNFEKEYELLKTLRSTFPNKNIRIDANQSWNYKEALENLQKCEHLDIEYCEEPLLLEEKEKLNALKTETKIDLAADESFRSKLDAHQIVKQKVFEIVILKPMMFGSFSEINVTKQLAESHCISVIFTTSLESIIGRTMTVIIASGLGSKKYAHGLATGSLLKYDIGEGMDINNGFFEFTKKPGLGINLNYKFLKEIK